MIVRGRSDDGRDLVSAREYISHGLRARAAHLATLELGPQTDLQPSPPIGVYLSVQIATLVRLPARLGSMMAS